MKLTRRIIVTGLTVAACATAVGIATAHASAPQAPTVAVSDGQPDLGIEDFGYPNADKIKEEKGITLKRGDGHIMLADCGSSTALMEVWSRKLGKTCFRVTGPSGYLTLEVPAVYAVKGGSEHATNVTLEAPDGRKQEVEVANKEWKGVGESLDPQAREHILVEISVGRDRS
ncbi:hypothetical protein IPZ58_26890 [Streptomyces roseoverticillatus]|uniref:hypothetical protein n=1 Tax=Streptomyces roseoverticillatus TaxID=66429 RepID=UPI001F35F7F1|nr:hypothetical protein [Streptomyces roseoverticillatus]MCF3105191.1 hypothetical protein [Streptomyces roseoverticillatus]